MGSLGSSFLAEVEVPPAAGAQPIVVWLTGEHDIATVANLGQTLSRAIALGPCAVVMDLSGVSFMGASTLGVIAQTRSSLERESRSLGLRSPSAAALRVLEICDFAGLLVLEGEAPDARTPPAPALASWVKVPSGSDGEAAAGSPQTSAELADQPRFGDGSDVEASEAN